MGVTCSRIKRLKSFKIIELPYNDSLIKKQLDFIFKVMFKNRKSYLIGSRDLSPYKKQTKKKYLKSNKQLIELHNQKIENAFWKVIQPIQISDLSTLEKQKFYINSLIKLGRVMLTMLYDSFAYEFDDKAIPDEMEERNKLNDSYFIESQVQYRFCLCKLATLENHIISPCKCAGSIKFVHLNCLQFWLNSQSKKKRIKWSSFKFKLFYYNICDVNKPKEPYLLIQINHNDKNKEQGLYVIEIKNRNIIKIERTQDCDIKLHDISVSRHHASIVINQNDQSFHIQDNCSKFGTLVLAQESDLQIHLHSQKRLALHVGRVVIVVKIQKKINKKKFNKYRVPSQAEVFRQIKQNEDKDEDKEIYGEQQLLDDEEEILINDPAYDKDQDINKFNNINFISGSIIKKSEYIYIYIIYYYFIDQFNLLVKLIQLFKYQFLDQSKDVDRDCIKNISNLYCLYKNSQKNSIISVMSLNYVNFILCF
ncbi:unnamed protein product [Paramecium primaurelia]|uniref:FHA domain protein n=1 Tax=Paramecium primaurelia TaxID=5886 RepID=A0A8S1N8A2_PARPR|nr:unnamed protein product [Paramecium primaurelia]